ncbi:hypothetical protein [Actinokineospora sp. UTMC 2448]|uniref:hypothetical protein n=1 Tax=Actinokineospora sp. UTMC 2448 TaxID=2268449 RepID=UPI002164C000|nr:hypothetical protein [Actinokineospora sp. UTMC 2448]UVS81811.1 hypothetical protein Actkin_05575 [Actinokineospora sp. UTMC 2448]
MSQPTTTTLRAAVDVVLALADGTTPDQAAADLVADLAVTATLGPGDEIHRDGLPPTGAHVAATVVGASWWSAEVVPAGTGRPDHRWFTPILDAPQSACPPFDLLDIEEQPQPGQPPGDVARRLRAYRLDVLYAALGGLPLSAYERRLLVWLADQPSAAATAVVASLVHRARASGGAR